MKGIFVPPCECLSMYFIFMITLHPFFFLSLCIFCLSIRRIGCMHHFPFVWFTFLFYFLVYMSCLPLWFHTCNVLERLYFPYF